MKRTNEKINKVVNFDGNEITVLQEVFSYEDGMKGACGIIFEPISRERYDDDTSFESIREFLKDASELPKEFEDGGYNEWTQAIIDNCEEGETIYDHSYSEIWDTIREELGLDEENAFVFNCIGGGRIFGENYQGNVNPELSSKIREYEKE